jgi:hypothetical protein
MTIIVLSCENRNLQNKAPSETLFKHDALVPYDLRSDLVLRKYLVAPMRSRWLYSLPPFHALLMFIPCLSCCVVFDDFLQSLLLHGTKSIVMYRGIIAACWT